jgi:hypothetical protein
MLAATCIALFLVPVTFSMAERVSGLLGKEHSGSVDQHCGPEELDDLALRNGSAAKDGLAAKNVPIVKNGSAAKDSPAVKDGKA